jgi:hypothetical protein
VPTQNTSTCSLQSLLNALLGVALQEQNMQIPPFIFSSWINTITPLLISALVKSYPSNPQVLDMLDPFVKFEPLPCKNGYITLPDDYRNIIGSPYILINGDKDGVCGKDEKIETQAQFQAAINRGRCLATPIDIIPESEFAVRTSSTYKYPDLEFPVGYFAGQRQIKICPYDLSRVFLLYARNEKTVNMTYIMQPDDTYLLDPSNIYFQDTEWTSAAFEPIFKALTSLYSAYSRDQELFNWTEFLIVKGIL